MGTVYLAEDISLRRQVAVKVLSPTLVGDDRYRRRFLIEARAAASLSHPNIAVVHEVGEESETVFIVMELVDGKPLEEFIARRPSPQQAVELAIGIADGLHHAHSKGIAHRDLKPSNVVVARDGAPKIIDFGLAKILEGHSWRSGEATVATLNHTEPGVVMGTLPYMSPEQALGREIDERIDLWALGVILYQLLTGELPFRDDHAGELLAAILRADPAPVRNRAPAVSAELEAIVARSLALEIDERYQSADEFASDLRALGDGGALGVAGSSRGRAVALPTIAVLPFANLGPTAEHEYISDGLTDELITVLGKIKGLRVVSRSSAFEFKGKPQDVRHVGALLNVKTVLEGSVRIAGDKIRVTTQLSNAADGYSLWSHSYDRDMKDVFALQEEIARTIARTLHLRLSDYGRSAHVRRRPNNVEAYQRYLKGRFHWHKLSPEGLELAVACFHEALQLDPEFAPALCGLADYHAAVASWSLAPPREAWLRAKELALRALELDDSLADARASLGQVAMYFEWNWPEAERHLLTARRLSPTYLVAHVEYTFLLIQTGRVEEALDAIREARRIDPLSLSVTTGLASTYYYAREYERALEVAATGLAIDEHHVELSIMSGLASLELQRYVEAVARLETLRQLVDGPLIVGALGHVYGRAGQPELARKQLERLDDLEDVAHVAPFSRAMVHLGLGNADEALDLLERAADHRDALMCYLAVFPVLDSVRQHPRFKALLDRMGLANPRSPTLSKTTEIG